MKKYNNYLSMLLVSLFIFTGCEDDYLNVLPEDSINSIEFWKNKEEAELALNGIYAVLRDEHIYAHGPGFDAITPNAHQWNGVIREVGRGSIHGGIGGIVTGRWTACYRMISRANYLLDNIERVPGLTEEEMARYVGEAHFLRGLAYSLLAETYGGVPIITTVIGVKEARELTRASIEETWNQAISDYDIAIENLKIDAPQVGRATKGAALGMKMRAYLYQNKYPEVLLVANQIIDLGKYSLFPSFEGLFLEENENNQEVIFDVQFITGPYQQGSYVISWHLPASGFAVPTHDLVKEYEMIDGSEVDPNDPYTGRDPRLGFTIFYPGRYFGDLLFPEEAPNHVGQPIKDLAMWKYHDYFNGEFQGVWQNSGEEHLNFIVLRYAEVILAKAEALIETNQNVEEAIALINSIRTERNDVKIKPLPLDLSQGEAREALRHERRVEFALEGIYWSDIKRWGIGPEIYPMEIRGTDGSLVETRYPNGYQLPKDNLFPIPDSELSLNENLTQNTGW